MKTRTNWVYQGKKFEDPTGYCGFVYLVSCNHPEETRKYIGRKFFFSKFGVKSKQKESDWRTYKTSSSHVNAALDKYGESYFTFEILQLFQTRGGVVSGEVEAQWEARVLHNKKPDGTPEYWNRQIGGIRFITPETMSEETRAKISAANKGMVRGPMQQYHKDKISAATRGRAGEKPSAETRNKFSQAKRGNAFKRNIEEWVVLEVYESYERGATQSQIAEMLNLPLGTVKTIRQKNQPFYASIYNEWVNNK